MRGAIASGLIVLCLAAPAGAQTAPDPNRPLTSGEVRELLDAAKATAKAARENVDYNRVVPDILFQILTKLDKLEDKLDRVEMALKRADPARARGR